MRAWARLPASQGQARKLSALSSFLEKAVPQTAHRGDTHVQALRSHRKGRTRYRWKWRHWIWHGGGSGSRRLRRRDLGYEGRQERRGGKKAASARHADLVAPRERCERIRGRRRRRGR